MSKYSVQVWIDEFEVDAANADEAADKAMDIVRNGDISIYPDYAEAHEIRKAGDGMTPCTSCKH